MKQLNLTLHFILCDFFFKRIIQSQEGFGCVSGSLRPQLENDASINQASMETWILCDQARQQLFELWGSSETPNREFHWDREYLGAVIALAVLYTW